jgi:hypothetical protein
MTPHKFTLHQQTRCYGAIRSPNYKKYRLIQGGSNMTGTDFCVNKSQMSRSYLNHLVHWKLQLTGVVTSQQAAPMWITMKLGEQAAWMDEDWHTHKTMRGLGSPWQWPWKMMYSLMWRLTAWQILTDFLDNTNSPHLWSIKRIRDHVKI